MPCKPLSCVCGKCRLPIRFLVVFMTFLGIICCYNMRSCLSMMITQMVRKKPLNLSQSEICPAAQYNRSEKIKGGRRSWTEEEQGYILQAFFIGYVITHIPGGYLGDWLGGRIILIASVASSCILTFFVPLIVDKGGWVLLYISRILVGMAQGTIYPAISSILGHWVPKNERSFLGSLSMSGSLIGSVTAFAVSGWLTDLFNSWPLVFYFWGLTSLGWCAFALVSVFSYPETHPFITEEELTYLKEVIHPKSKKKCPWKDIFSDMAVWAIVIGKMGHDWLMYTLYTDLPKYLDNVLGFKIKKTGFVASMPYIAMWICTICCGLLADWLTKKKEVRILTVRRIFSTVGMVLPAVLALLAIYAGCHQILAVTFFTLTLFAKGPLYSGIKINHLDITQNFTGMVQALVNGAGGISGIATPMIIGFICKKHSLSEWRLVFWITFGVSIGTLVVYLIFAKDEKRDWDKIEEEAKA